MVDSGKPSQQIDTTFTAAIRRNICPGGWTVVVMPGSGKFFGTRKPIKVAGTIDGHPFQATLLPLGDGTHMLPIRAALRKMVGKDADDQVIVHLQQRPS